MELNISKINTFHMARLLTELPSYVNVKPSIFFFFAGSRGKNTLLTIFAKHENILSIGRNLVILFLLLRTSLTTSCP